MNAITHLLITMAQQHAAADTQHGYTNVDDFQPHDWVVAAMLAAYEAGLAHPRPTGDETDLDTENDDLAANNYRLHSRIGELEAQLELLTANAASAPTVEQAGDVVAFRIIGRHGPYPWVDGKPKPELEFIVGEGERLQLAYGQPHPVGVPDDRIIDLANRLVAPGPKACAVSASECHELTDFILSLATAPAPAKGDEA